MNLNLNKIHKKIKQEVLMLRNHLLNLQAIKELDQYLPYKKNLLFGKIN